MQQMLEICDKFALVNSHFHMKYTSKHGVIILRSVQRYCTPCIVIKTCLKHHGCCPEILRGGQVPIVFDTGPIIVFD